MQWPFCVPDPDTSIESWPHRVTTLLRDLHYTYHLWCLTWNFRVHASLTIHLPSKFNCSLYIWINCFSLKKKARTMHPLTTKIFWELVIRSSKTAGEQLRKEKSVTYHLLRYSTKLPLPELRFWLSFQNLLQEKISENIFWKSLFLPKTISDKKFCSTNHFSKQSLVLVIDIISIFFFWKHDFQNFSLKLES